MAILAHTPLVLETVLLWLLIRRREYTGFPWFFCYMAFGVIADVARLVVRNNSDLYFAVYWTTEAGYDLLEIAVLYEVFWAVFRNLGRIWWFRLVFPLTITFTITLAIIHSRTHPPQFSTLLRVWIVTSELAVRLLQVSVFALLVGLVSFLGLRWRQHAFGISAGFGIYATVALLATTKFSEFGTGFMFTWGVLLIVAYSIAVLIWIWFFSMPTLTEQICNAEPPLSLQELERYKQIARRIRRR